MPGTGQENTSVSRTHGGDNQRTFPSALLGLFQEVGRFPQELAVDGKQEDQGLRSPGAWGEGDRVHGCLQQGSSSSWRLGVPLLSTSQEREQVNG